MSEPFEGIKQGLIEAITIEKVMKENRRLEACLHGCRIMLRDGYSHAEVIHKIGVYLKEALPNEKP